MPESRSFPRRFLIVSFICFLLVSIVFLDTVVAVEESLGSDMPVVIFGLSNDLVTFHEVEAFLALRARYPAPEIA